MTEQQHDPEFDEDDVEEIEEIFEPFAWDGDTVDASSAILERGSTYGLYVIMSRSVPDVRDGLKPVQRRVLFSMAKLGLWPEKNFAKSARITGECIGNYHPHGDKSIYDAMVNMTHDWENNAPLVIGQGNFGNQDDYPAAAMRYTEAKLAEVASPWLRSDTLHSSIVPFRDTFDERNTEPVVLPTNFPVLLVNGVMGISVGMTTNFPTHNLNEVIDATIMTIEDRNVSVKRLLKKMPGPDFPTGAIISNPSELLEAYTKGHGRVVMLPRYHFESGNRNSRYLVITELPFGIGPKKVFREIIDGFKAGTITEVADERPVDQSDKKGIRLVIKMKHNGNEQALVNELLKRTSIRKSVPINFTVITSAREAKTLGLREVLLEWIDFRFEVVRKRFEYERSKLMGRLEELAAWRSAADALDEVIKIIRTTPGGDDKIRQALCKRLEWTPVGMAIGSTHKKHKKQPITPDQAQFIMDTQLKRLSRLNIHEVEQEFEKKLTRVREIDDILLDENKLKAFIIDELRQQKKLFGRPRCSEISGVDIAAEAADVSAIADIDAPVKVYVSRSGKAVAVDPDRSFRSTPFETLKSDPVVGSLLSNSSHTVLVFTANGQCHRLRVAELDVQSAKSKGQGWVPIADGDAVVAIVSDEDIAPKDIAFVTAQGKIKRLERTIFEGAHSQGVIAMKVPDGDKIVQVLAHTDGDELLVQSRQGQLLRTPLAPFRLVKGGNSGGVALMRLGGEDDIVVGAALANKDHVLLVHESGAATATAVSEFPVKGSGGAGVRSVNMVAPKAAPAGPVAKMIAVSHGDQVLLENGTTWTYDKKVKTVARAATSTGKWTLSYPVHTA